MQQLNKTLIVFAIISFLLLLQQFRFLSIKNVNPNLVLIVFLIIIFSGSKKWFLGLTLLAFLIFFLETMPFWSIEAILFFALIIFIKILSNFLTGHPMSDFLISLILGTIIFQFLIQIKEIAGLKADLILSEVIYNLILGMIGWIILYELPSGKFSQKSIINL